MSNDNSTTKKTNVHVALDLGSDTLKIAFAFHLNGKEYTGKIVHSPNTKTALPAVAFYDVDNGKWYFAEEVIQQQTKSYLTVVKIKSLISLLQNKGKSESVYKSNVKCYDTGNHFPKFFFPIANNEVQDFQKLIDEKSTFVAKGCTPKSVCEAYFMHVAKMVEKRLAALMKKHNCAYNLFLSVVYPPHVGKDYVSELVRVIQVGFGKEYPVNLVYSMTKALSIYAAERQLLHHGEKALIFNVGEEKTFVAKAHLFGSGISKKISIDGVEGHSEAIDLGGNDIDRAVANYLEDKMADRETMGSPSVGSPGHIYEHGLLNKQYLFMQDIKSAKIVFGMFDKNDDEFKQGATINVARELIIKMKLKHDEFARCIGIRTDGKSAMKGSFVEKLCKYVEKELDGYVNQDVTHVFISGGVVETYGLVEVIREHVKNINPDVKVQTFESEESKPYSSNSGGYEIFAHEDAVYAPALGCAIASLNNIRVATVTSYTYGTDASGGPDGTFVLSPLLDKETEIPEEGLLAAKGYTVSSGRPAVPLFIFSLTLSEREIREMKYGYQKIDRVEYASGRLSLANLINFGRNKRNEVYFRKMQRIIGFRQRNDDKDAKITFHYRGKRVKLVYITQNGKLTDLSFEAGIQIDGSGIATPYARNSVEDNKGIDVQVVEIVEKPDGTYVEVGSVMYAKGTDIEFRCKPFAISVEGRD